MATKLKKKQMLRNNEYYNIQNTFDELYSKAQNNQNFTNLLDVITANENILLAYRNIKKNKGSKTSGTNRNTIIDIGSTEPQKLIDYVKYRLKNFTPHSIRRVEIEKENGKIRPLGIPTIEDRLLQQCIKQVLEPICEAKFYKHSYGFRPNRGTHHAIARAMHLAQNAHLQYVIDIDIKGFFDNVNHGKLLKQMWALGVQDKNLLCIISKMLKAEVKGIGIPEKGTPQGGILSPLLSNIVLNELDWWVASQWETFKTVHQYVGSNKYRKLHKTDLKEMFIVRYADDFKIFCRSKDVAVRMFESTKLWLKERLGLEISPGKSKIVNLKRHYSEFLGIKLKLRPKSGKMVVRSHMTQKAINKCKKKLKDKIKKIQKVPSVNNISSYNATILGMHNYYGMATHISLDFKNIAFEVNKSLKCRLSCIKGKPKRNETKSVAFQKFYGGCKGKVINVNKIALFPISHIKFKIPLRFTQDVCNYTEQGRELIHDRLRKIDVLAIRKMLEIPVNNSNVEFYDNRISLYVGQQGKCYVTGERLEISNMEVHHKTPKENGGKDNYNNLVLVSYDSHKLIHAKSKQTIDKYLGFLGNEKIDTDKLNKLRVLVGNCELNANK